MHRVSVVSLLIAWSQVEVENNLACLRLFIVLFFYIPIKYFSPTSVDAISISLTPFLKKFYSRGNDCLQLLLISDDLYFQQRDF